MENNDNILLNPSEAGELTKEEKFFVEFKNAKIECDDPSLEGQFVKLYEEEIPFEIRIKDGKPQNDSIFAKLLCRIYYRGENNDLTKIKIEINYDKDIFFFYRTYLDKESFNKLKETQKFLNKFKIFPELFGKYLELCDSDKEHYLAVFNIYKDKTAKLEILENLNYKFVEIITLNFVLCTDDFEIRNQVIYRYDLMREMYRDARKRVKIINQVLKENESNLIPDIKHEISKLKIDTNIRNKSLLEEQFK